MTGLKRFLAVLIATAALASLAGCGGEAAPDEAIAMGRYIEQAWESPPLDEKGWISGEHCRPDGKIALITRSSKFGDVPRYYVADGNGGWAEESPAWLETLCDAAIGIDSIDFNSKGEGVAAYFGFELGGGGEERRRLALLHTDGSISDAAIDTTEDPWDPSMSFYVRNVFLGEDGMVYIESDFSGAGRFDPETGELLASYLGASGAFALAGSDAVQLLAVDSARREGHAVEQNSLFFSDAATGVLGRTLPSENLALENGIALAEGEDGSLYIAGARGLFRLAKGGDSWELILDGDLCSLAIPSASVYRLIPHGDNEFLALLQNIDGGETKLVNFAYSAETPTLPDGELTVFSMAENMTVAQAVGVFRQKHPATLVNIRTGRDMTDTGNGDDMRAALNTEVLAGKGPDLFVFEDLPVESYMEKGVLADLSEVIDPLLASGSILPAVAKAYADESGIYAVPARVSLPTLWGDEAAIAAAGDLDALLAYAKANPDVRLFGNMEPKHLLYQLSSGSWGGLLAGGELDVAAAEHLLATVIALSETAEKAHFYEYFGTEEYLAKGETDTDFVPTWDMFGRDGEVAAPEDYYAAANNRAALMPAFLTGFDSVRLPNGAMNKRLGRVTDDTDGDGSWHTFLPDEAADKLVRAFPAGLYLPGCVLGVNAASSQKELAMAFVEAVLSAEAQAADLGDGFPVNREAIARNVGRDSSWYSTISYSFDNPYPLAEELEIEYALPSEKTLATVAEHLAAIETPMLAGYSLPVKYSMQELLPLALDQVISGEATAREAAEWLAEQFSLVLAE